MKYVFTILFLLVATVVTAQGGIEPITPLIKKLSSKDFRVRHAAAEALKKRPDAVAELRKALSLPDVETSRRVGEILDHLEFAKLQELRELVKKGSIEKAIEWIATWPREKHDGDLWNITCELAKTMNSLHRKHGGKGLGHFADMSQWESLPIPIQENRLTDPCRFRDLKTYFVRCREAELDFSNYTPDRNGAGAVVSSGSLRLRRITTHSLNIYACQSVEITGGPFFAIIVSGGDVTLRADLDQSLIIARGNVHLDNAGRISRSRIIAGKAVSKKNLKCQDCIITENDSNPLGYIRWTDAPKDKPAPKAK